MAHSEDLRIVKRGVDAWNQWRRERPGSTPDLSGGDIGCADLAGANFTDCNLSRATLSLTDLSGADFTRADLSYGELAKAVLTDANLTRAVLTRTDLSGATLHGAKFHETIIDRCLFIDVDLRGCTGLEDAAANRGEPIIDVRTLYKSDGDIPFHWFERSTDLENDLHLVFSRRRDRDALREMLKTRTIHDLIGEAERAATDPGIRRNLEQLSAQAANKRTRIATSLYFVDDDTAQATLTDAVKPSSSDGDLETNGSYQCFTITLRKHGFEWSPLWIGCVETDSPPPSRR